MESDIKYDVIHLAGNSDDRELISSGVTRRYLHYLSVGSLKELESILPDNNPSRNDGLWLVDGSFPEEEGGPISFNAPRAIDLIRGTYPDSRILLYSADERASRTAEEMRVKFKDKNICTAEELVKYMKRWIKD